MEEEAENMDQIQQDAGNEVPVPDMNALNLNEDNDRKTNKDLPSKLCDPKQFPTWALRMRIHFEAIAVWDIVTGERQPSAEDDLDEVLQRYRKQKSRAHSDLLRCLGEKFQPLASTYETVSDLWEALNDLLQPEDSTQLFETQKLIESLERSEPFTDCLLKLKLLVRKLVQMGGTYSNGQKVAKLLALFPPSYSEFALQIQTLEMYKVLDEEGEPTNEINFDEVYKQTYKRALLEETTSSNSAKVLYSNANSETENSRGLDRSRSQRPRNKQGLLTCYNCSERGHIAANCPYCSICLGKHPTKSCSILERAKQIHSEEQRAPATVEASSREQRQSKSPRRTQHEYSANQIIVKEHCEDERVAGLEVCEDPVRCLKSVHAPTASSDSDLVRYPNQNEGTGF